MIGSALIKQLAEAAGFADCGIARADRLTEEEFPLNAWLAAGYQAEMHYMERNAEMRCDPRLLVENAQSVISLVVPYKPDRQISSPGSRYIAQYAYGEDYHIRLKRMMFSLIAELKKHYSNFEGRPFVDTAPISDRHWAVRAGLGWIGRNTLFVHPQFGSFCYLGEIVTTADVDCYDEPYKDDGCGDCHLCIDACPNRAITASTSGSPMLDSRRCTSYNTIENRDLLLPDDIDTRGYAFGCDICQIACPCNKDTSAAFHLDDSRKALLESLPDADEESFNRITQKSALSRIKYHQWQRNINKTRR